MKLSIIGGLLSMCGSEAYADRLQGRSGYLSAAIPRLFEGEIHWPCWNESQRVVLALGEFEGVGPGKLRSKGIELYAIRSRYRSVEVVLEIDVADLRFKLSEQYPELRMLEIPIGDGVYEGRLLDNARLMSSIGNDSGAACLPDLLLSAVPNAD